MLSKLRSLVEPRTKAEALRLVAVFTLIAVVVAVSLSWLGSQMIGTGQDAFLISATVIPLILAPPMTWIGAKTMLRLESIRQELARVACVDPLSGALNRRGLQQFAERCFAARETHGELSAIIFDLDRFKSINDTFGHAAGDAVISQLVRVIDQAGDHDRFVVGRLGGDELVAYFAGLSFEETMMRAEYIRQAIEEAVLTHEGQRIRVTASIGVASATPEDRDHEPMLKRADRALYAAKSAGRNRVRAAA